MTAGIMYVVIPPAALSDVIVPAYRDKMSANRPHLSGTSSGLAHAATTTIR